MERNSHTSAGRLRNESHTAEQSRQQERAIQTGVHRQVFIEGTSEYENGFRNLCGTLPQRCYGKSVRKGENYLRSRLTHPQRPGQSPR